MDCFRNTTIDIEQKIRRTIFPHLKINFNFLVKSRFLNYRRAPHSGTGPELIEGFPNSDFENIAAGKKTFRKSLSYDKVLVAVKGALAGTPLLRGERQRVVERAWKKLCETCPRGETLSRCIILDLDFTVVIEHLHVYTTEVVDYPRMIPAADSALGLLEKCEVGCAGEAERGCCICLEDLGGGEAAARMPCKHVFHGGCIEEWLRTSHYCPLCRYEMPTE